MALNLSRNTKVFVSSVNGVPTAGGQFLSRLRRHLVRRSNPESLEHSRGREWLQCGFSVSNCCGISWVLYRNRNTGIDYFTEPTVWHDWPAPDIWSGIEKRRNGALLVAR